MGRFHFHLKLNDGSLIEDEEGEDLPDAARAAEMAAKSTRELLVDAIRSGADFRIASIVVVNEQARSVLSLPVVEVLPWLNLAGRVK